jgi:arylsulfatase A-like enzyme
MVYNIEVFRAAIRQGNWKLVWRTPLPQLVELYDLAQDPAEQTNLAAAHPDVVATLQRRANELAATMVPSPLLATEFQAVRGRLAQPPALPGAELDLDAEP